MSGRIRTIKPEILDDEEAASLSDAAWRLWVSLWVLVDDHGNCRASHRYLASSVFQNSNRDVDPLLAELERARRVELYQVGATSYLHVRNWEKHQRIDNAGRPRVPPPPGSADLASVSPRTAANLREPPRESESLGEPPRTSATRARADAQSRRETTTPTTDHEPTTTPTRDHPRGVGYFGTEREWFAMGIREGTGNPGYTAPAPARCGQLLELLHANKPGASIGTAETWLIDSAADFARATSEQRRFWPLTPDSLAKWVGEGRPSKSALQANVGPAIGKSDVGYTPERAPSPAFFQRERDQAVLPPSNLMDLIDGIGRGGANG